MAIFIGTLSFILVSYRLGIHHFPPKGPNYIEWYPEFAANVTRWIGMHFIFSSLPIRY